MKSVVSVMVLVLLLVLRGGGAIAQEDSCQVELKVVQTADGVEFVRTPDACFANLPNWTYEARYVEIDGLRQAYVDEGPVDAKHTVLLLHGQPTWSYLYRTMIPALVAAGHRVIAMDNLGMGRSDKPIDPNYYTYLGHVHRLEIFIQALRLDQTDLTLFAQDWGSLFGLYVAGVHPDWFDRIVIGDGSLPVFPANAVPFPLPEQPAVTRDLFFRGITSIPAQQPIFYDSAGNLLSTAPGVAGAGTFGAWIDYARNDERFRPSQLVEAMTYFDVPDDELAAYDAPFPSRIAMGGPRSFPGLVNQMPGLTQHAWDGLGAYVSPFLTIWGGNDPGNLGQPAVQQALIRHIPGAAGRDHVRLPEASHFLQDDQGPEIARRINVFIAATVPVLADEIPVAHTPEGFWRGEMPAPILARCTEPLASGIPDIRGLWRAYAVEVNGQAAGDTGYSERIEQCGNRVVITAGGVIHDMRADGTLERGVNDVAAVTGAPITVAATFENGRLVLRPDGGPIAVTRELVDGDLVFTQLPIARVTRLRRVS